MKALRFTSTAILSLLLGVAAPAYAQEQNEGRDHHEQKQSEHQQVKPEAGRAQQQHGNQNQAHTQQQPQVHNEQNQQHAQQQQNQNKENERHAQQQQQAQNKQKQNRHHAQQQAKQQRSNQPQRTQEQRHVEQAAWQQHRSGNWQSDHRTWQQRGGYHGYRVPDDRYRGYFGPSHGFRIVGLPFMVVDGYPRFQYQGYWISAVDPWPEYWGNNWYDNDDVYITYVDSGYYLYNRRYPQQGLAINISF